MRNKKHLKPIKDLLAKYDWDKKKYISEEWQDYAYRLAQYLDDSKRMSLYMKLAKESPREWLEEAKNFVKGAYDVKSKSRLFMWKLKQIRLEKKK